MTPIEKEFIQPEFVLQKIGRQIDRQGTYVVKNLEMNKKPFFVKGGIYSYRKCTVKDKIIDWVDYNMGKALCIDVINHNRNMIVIFSTIEDQVPKNFMEQVKGWLGLKPKMVAPLIPDQIMVQLIGGLQQKEGA